MSSATLLHPRKVVAHDHGELWHGALAIHDDPLKSFSAFGNPWLGGGQHLLTTGVNDMARLDALTPGAAERVALVGDGCLQFAHWDSAELEVILTQTGASETAGAQMVRAAPFAPQHLIVTVHNLTNPPSSSMRLYRYHSTTGVFAHVATPPVVGPVLDVEITRTATNAARILYRNAAGVTCIEPSGTEVWSVPGTDGVLVRWPLGAPLWWGAWVRHVAGSGNWKLQLLRDTNPVPPLLFDLGSAIAGNVQAALAADADHDGDIDLVVRSDAGIAVVENQGPNTTDPQDDFSALAVVVVPDSDPGRDCVPDLLITHAGWRLRVLDTNGVDKILWRRVDLPLGQTEAPEGMDLRRYTAPPDPHVFGGGVPEATTTTRIDFQLNTSAGFLAPFAVSGTETNIQVVAWEQDHSWGGSPLEESETNDVFPLSLTQGSSVAYWWQLHMTLDRDCSGPAPVWDGDDADALYWVAIRIVNTPIGATVPNSVSEPIVLATTLSPDEEWTWDYISSQFCGGLDLTRLEDRTPIPIEGGGVVGVIERTREPPPPPPSGIPSPRAADLKGKVWPFGAVGP